MYARRDDWRCSITACSVFAHGSSVFQVRRCSTRVEVAGGDPRQPGLCHPAERLAAVEELVAVDQAVKPLPVSGEPTGGSGVARIVSCAVWVSRDDRGPGLPRGEHRRLETVVDRAEGVEAECERMAGLVGVVVEVGQLGIRDQQQVVLLARARRDSRSIVLR
jgi:hypothetical protein